MLTVLAAEGGSPVSVQLMPLVTALVVFTVAFMVLKTAVWPKITKGLDDRDKKIRDEIESAEEAREQAKSALAEYQRNLSSAREEANKMIAQARADAKAAGDELRSRNEAELVELKARATKDIETARQAAVNSLYAEASNLAVQMAGKILQREINAGDQQRLVDDSLRELANAGRN
jgi:F-type H+-transporting ATPase subunit b